MKKLLSLFLCILLLGGCAATYDGPTRTIPVLSRSEFLVHGSSGEIIENTKTEYTYDIYGNPVQLLHYNVTGDFEEEELTEKTTLRYDKSGNLIRKTLYDVTGWLPKQLSDIRYTYDAQGRLTETCHDGNVTLTVVYDDDTRTRTTTTETGAVTVEYLDERGFLLRSEATSSGGETIVEEYDRREDGEWTVNRTYRGGECTSVSERTFDEQGRPLLWTKTEDGETVTVYRWEYGETYEVQYYEAGKDTTVYHPDGTVMYRYSATPSGKLLNMTYYYYTEIQVPAEGDETP